MKTSFKLFLSTCAAASLAACGGGSDGPPPPADDAEDAAPVDATAEAPADTPATDAPAPDNTETLDGTQLANFTGTAEAGEQVFAQCQVCHVVEESVNRTGPSLYNIVGREAGRVEDYNYTPANADSGITWTPEKLFQYLEDPQRVIPGTKMAFAGLPEAQDRADIIAFLETHSQ